LKTKKYDEFLPYFESLMEDEHVVANELTLLAFNIRKEFCGVFDSFLSFLKKYEGKKNITWFLNAIS
jgi:hypothetical protein